MVEQTVQEAIFQANEWTPGLMAMCSLLGSVPYSPNLFLVFINYEYHCMQCILLLATETNSLGKGQGLPRKKYQGQQCLPTLFICFII